MKLIRRICSILIRNIQMHKRVHESPAHSVSRPQHSSQSCCVFMKAKEIQTIRTIYKRKNFFIEKMIEILEGSDELQLPGLLITGSAPGSPPHRLRLPSVKKTIQFECDMRLRRTQVLFL
ncbi:hypothetical protein FQA47_015497 [Oryzias melastigma]|uniref:Uncharacterized protein n=1 Tax=Oryzias melastigma TaxID=30732 RepID=A0A834FR30_ORYME|nr:hypothetical protein FQA47_015497 [Oryzias melastigma]